MDYKYLYMKIFVYHIIFLLFISSFILAQEKGFSLQNGDLIFQEACSGNMNKAIKEVTSGIEGYNFTHVGMVWIDSLGKTYVIEATHPRVCITPLQEFLYPKDQLCPPKSVVGRLKEAYQPLIPLSIEEAKKQVGKEYDDAFDLNNDQYYCSELIYWALYKANQNKDVFPLNTMTFKSSPNGAYAPYWLEHFKKLQIPVPEGQLGINPGAMSRSDVISIVYYY